MGFRYFRRIRVSPWLSINVSRSGISTSIGRHGLHLTVGPRGTTESVGIPGTGISYRETQPAPRGAPEGLGWLGVAVLIGLFLLVLGVLTRL
jgi:hypothetical protein